MPPAQHIHIEATELQKPFAPLPAAVLFAADLSMGARCCYAALVWLAWQEHFSQRAMFEGQEWMAGQLGVSRQTISAYMKELRDEGYIETRHIGLGQPDLIIVKRLPAGEWNPLGPDPQP